MANVPNFIGELRRGDQIEVPVEWYDASWVPSYYDVLDNDTKTYISQDNALTTGVPDLVQWIDFTVDGDYKEGRYYTIIVKENTGEPPTEGTNAFLLTFRVKAIELQAYLGFVEKGKTFYFMIREYKGAVTQLYYDVFNAKTGTAISSDTALSSTSIDDLFTGSIDTSSSSFATGRTYFLRVKDGTGDSPNWNAIFSFTVTESLEVHFTSLGAYAGENVVLDNFSYDQAGNILGLRVRLFETASDADNATAGVTDPEPGEFKSILITQEHDVPRNVRTFHKSVVEWESGTFPPDP